MKKTIFVKKKGRQTLVTGTCTSSHNGLLLTSTGIPTLDDVLGGGLPVGAVLMVEEDQHSRFSSVLTKYVLPYCLYEFVSVSFKFCANVETALLHNGYFDTYGSNPGVQNCDFSLIWHTHRLSIKPA